MEEIKKSEGEKSSIDIGFEDIITLLKKFPVDRSPTDLDILYNYFNAKTGTRKPIQFFEKCKEENGEATVRMLCEVLHYQKNNINERVINFGEIGSKFYINLKGEVAVRVPALIQKAGTLMQIIEFIVTEYEWITDNEMFQRCLAEINRYYPYIVIRNKNERLCLNMRLCKKIFDPRRDKEGKYQRYYDRIPEFEADDFGRKEKEYRFDCLVDVVHLKEGGSFGELALINNTPRSATICTVTECHFATIQKDDFKLTLGKVMRKKFVKMIKFMENFSILSQLSRLALEKFALYFSKYEVKRGKQIMVEQEDASYVCFIEEGEFEISKTVLFEKDKIKKGIEEHTDRYRADFLRYITPEFPEKLEHLINQQTGILFSSENDELGRFKKNSRCFKKERTEKISIIGKNETTGIVEVLLGCPYYACTVTCISGTGIYHKVNKEDLFRKIDPLNPNLLQLVKQKLILMSKTTSKFLGVQRTLQQDFNASQEDISPQHTSPVQADELKKLFKYKEIFIEPKKELSQSRKLKKSKNANSNKEIDNLEIEALLANQKSKGKKRRLLSISRALQDTNQLKKNLERSYFLSKAHTTKNKEVKAYSKFKKQNFMVPNASPVQDSVKKATRSSKFNSNLKIGKLLKYTGVDANRMKKASPLESLHPNIGNSNKQSNPGTPSERSGTVSYAKKDEIRESKGKVYSLPFRIIPNLPGRCSTLDTRNPDSSFRNYAKRRKSDNGIPIGATFKYCSALKTLNYSENNPNEIMQNLMISPKAVFPNPHEYGNYPAQKTDSNRKSLKNLDLAAIDDRFGFLESTEVAQSQESQPQSIVNALNQRKLSIDQARLKNANKNYHKYFRDFVTMEQAMHEHKNKAFHPMPKKNSQRFKPQKSPRKMLKLPQNAYNSKVLSQDLTPTVTALKSQELFNIIGFKNGLKNGKRTAQFCRRMSSDTKNETIFSKRRQST
ncbi:unnamed protein product [Moneuplotes crassus]|uniref:Cyclic nucleotide-binding domain-containing protein n=1 Tax=Euplotes crassus TaxID=5936 RepID=A0AAD1UUB3_EUPCR|nr:unnamed protein product [Moneuplotes crassus]